MSVRNGVPPRRTNRYPAQSVGPGYYQCIIRNWNRETRTEAYNAVQWEELVAHVLRSFIDQVGSSTSWHCFARHDYAGGDDATNGPEDAGQLGSNACAEGSHLHICYRHYKGKGYTIGRFLGELAVKLRCAFRFSCIMWPRAYREYLRSGGGRTILYEKNSEIGQLPEQTEFHADSRWEEVDCFRRESGLSPVPEDSSSCQRSQTGNSGDESNERDMDFWHSEKKAVPWNFQRGVEQVLKIFPALDVQAFKEYVLNQSNPKFHDWFQRMKNMRDFNQKVNDEIIEMRTCNINTPWYHILRSTDCETFELLCDRPVMTLQRSVECIETILKHNDVRVADFVWLMWKLMDRKSGKKNAIHFRGEVNSGKTLLANSIARSLVYYSVLNKVGKSTSESTFVFEPLIAARVAILNECIVNDNNYEDFLQLTEGEKMPVQVKYKAPVALKRVPLILTSNTCLWEDCSQWRSTIASRAFPERVWTINFTSCEELMFFSGQDIHPYVWLLLIDKYVDEQEISTVWSPKVVDSE